jgi:hypothetical protein
MRIVFSKLTHEKSHSLDGVVKETAGLTATGEEFRADIRYLDISPFGFEAFGSVTLTKEQFESITPGKIYDLSIVEIGK